MSKNHRADEKRFLDERGSDAPLAPNGLNPANIMEKPVRDRIIDSYFWKDQCFAVNEADIIDRVLAHVHFIGGTYGDAQKPSPFLCLAFKLLQLGPDDNVLKEYLEFGGEKFKYLRALACFYVRLTRKAPDVYTLLEPYLEDRRKLKRRTRMGTSLTFVDQFVDDLLTKDRMCATTLWKLPKREVLEDLEVLEPRVSPLGDIEDLLESDVEETKGDGSGREESPGSEFGEITPERDIDRGRDDEANGMDIDDAPESAGTNGRDTS
ncbi:PRP38 family-domain-containing protein [Halenospora varia]|nr:PRP38 family-domain-containing protein [Halenospora varia]